MHKFFLKFTFYMFVHINKGILLHLGPISRFYLIMFELIQKEVIICINNITCLQRHEFNFENKNVDGLKSTGNGKNSHD